MATKKKSTTKAAKNEAPKLDKWQKLNIFLIIVSLAGFIGWVWEFILMEIKGGFSHLYVNGGNFLPWMNLYAYGAIVILITCYRLRKKPWVVFLVGMISTGLLELFAGWAVYTVGNGMRYWDYSKSWIGVGHINGFVCPASVFVFGLAALFLIYVIMPRCIALVQRMPRKTLLILAASIFAIIMVDDIVNLTLKNLDQPTARDFYIDRGWVVFEE